MPTLLITATINSGYYGNVGTKVCETEKRKKEYSDNLYNYLVHSKFNKIIFAENSGDKLDEAYFYQIARKNQKELEFLYLPCNVALMNKYGKSYGEAKLIEDAMSVSRLLPDEKVFYKVTGRIWISNINKLITEKKENCFISHSFMGWVLTSFFKVRTDDFRMCLADAHSRCNDFSNDCIEHVYFESLSHAEYPIKSFRIYPDMRGINSGSGYAYTKSRTQLFIRNVLIKFGVFDLDCKTHWYNDLLQKANIWLHRR